jgi:cell division protein FtsW
MALLAVGVVMVNSAAASVSEPGPWYSRVETRHTVFAVLAAITLLLGARFDYRLLQKGKLLPIIPALLVVFSIALCVAVFIPGVGREVGGYYRWIRLGPAEYSIGFQPSELLKFSLIIFLAAWLSRKKPEGIDRFHKTFLPAALLSGGCLLLVISQDFGSSTLIGVGVGLTLLLARVPLWQLATSVPFLGAGFWVLVVNNPHRWARITAFLDPWSMENPSAYQPSQSLQAILSGGWFGMGPGNGTHKLGFLPEDTTDFIFSILCEEWGFLGAMMMIGLVIFWIILIVRISSKASDGFGCLLAGSLGFLIAVQAILHMAVALVMAPPTGMSMPLVSAGGTSLVMMAAATALIASVGRYSREEEMAV